jgi:hypothetical protein
MVSAIILNYLDPELTARCVHTLYEAAEKAHQKPEVIVVDNSAPKTAEELHRLLPDEVIIIENEENAGFSKANNIGIARAQGEYILIMNNDLFINAEVLLKGLEYINSHENVGVWAPKLTDQQGNPQRSCARFPTLPGLVSEYFMKISYNNRIALKAVKADQPVLVDTVIGACMLIPKTILEEVGGFDEDYFFNSEDVDLCRKIKSRGYDVVFDARCSAIHLVSASQGGTQWYENTYLHKARILYFKKNHHPLTCFLAKIIIRAGIKAREFKHYVLG